MVYAFWSLTQGHRIDFATGQAKKTERGVSMTAFTEKRTYTASIPTTAQFNYVSYDNILQWILAEYLPEADRDTYLEMLEAVGDIVGTSIASRNKENDRIGAKLVKRKIAEKDGDDREINDVELPPGMQQSFRELIETGLMSVTVGDQYRKDGSSQLPYMMEMAFMVKIAEADAATFLLPMLSGGVARTLEKFASDELKDKYLPRMCSSDPNDLILGAMLLTEPNAGSDVGAVRTRARKDGDIYRITGTKMFITSPHSDVLLTLARPEGAPEGTKGLGLFLIPRILDDGSVNTYEISRLEDKMGIHGSATAEIVFDDAVGYPVGDIHSGFKHMLLLMNHSRLKIGLQGLGILKRAFTEAVRYSRDRMQFGKSIQEFPAVRELLCRMAVDNEAMTHLLFRNAIALDGAENPSVPNISEKYSQEFYEKLVRLLTPVSKARATDLSVINASRGVQIHGGYGYIREYQAEQLYRDAKITCIYEGTNEIQALDVLRALTREETLPVLVTDIKNLIDEEHGLLSGYRNIILTGLEKLQEAIQLVSGKERPALGALHAGRILATVADLYCAALLYNKAVYDLNSENARGTAVLHLFVKEYLQKLSAVDEVLQAEESWAAFFDYVVDFMQLSPADFQKIVEK